MAYRYPTVKVDGKTTLKHRKIAEEALNAEVERLREALKLCAAILRVYTVEIAVSEHRGTTADVLQMTDAALNPAKNQP